MVTTTTSRAAAGTPTAVKGRYRLAVVQVLVLALLLYLASLLLLRLPDRRLASGLAHERPSRVPVPARGRPSLEPSPAPHDKKEEAA